MVAQLGMSAALGPVDFGRDYELLSTDTKSKIEHEVRRLIEEGQQRATTLLTEKRKELDLLAKALVEYEVLSLEETQKVIKGEKLEKMKSSVKMPMVLPEIVLPPGMGGGTGAPGTGLGGSPGAPGTRKVARKGDGDGGEGGGAKL